MLFTDLMGGAQRAYKMPVVSTELRQHVRRRDAFFVVVFETLVPSNITDRMERCAADLAGPLSDIVRHTEDLVSLLVQQKMIIAKVISRHVPVEVLGLDVKRKYICQQSAKGIGNLVNHLAAEASPAAKDSFAGSARVVVFCFCTLDHPFKCCRLSEGPIDRPSEGF